MGRPKALLPIRGQTFLESILNSIAQSHTAAYVVVLGHHRNEIEETLRIDNPVFNPNYEKGMITSIQAGIRGLPPETEGALLFLVDHPIVAPGTLDVLIHAFKPDHIILPTFEGRRGHPVLFPRMILDEILALPETMGANTVLWKDPSRVVEIPVDDPGIVMDIDTPQQYADYSGLL